MHPFRHTAPLLLWLLAGVSPSDAVQFKRDILALPVSSASQTSSFADLNNDRMNDLLVIDQAENRLLVYRQKPAGFNQTPDQVIRLPAQTAWIAPSDADPHPGLELLMSTSAGLVYLRQDGGVFESEPRPLIKTAQVLTNGAAPILISLTRPHETNDAVPMIEAEQVVIHKRNGAFEWSAEPPMEYQTKRSTWLVRHENNWRNGPNPSWRMFAQDTFLAHPDKIMDAKRAEDDALRKKIDFGQQDFGWHQNGIDHADLNGDGREDVVMWNVVVGGMNVRSDVYVFLRGADGRLPEQPGQLLHCRGFPMPGPTQHVTPLCDLKGDGKFQLVIVSMKTSILSSSGIMETLLSSSLNWTLTIRDFRNGAFAENPEASIVLNTMASQTESAQDLAMINGDFNGDGRPDILVRRSATQWNLLPSSTGGNWFLDQPAATFEIPAPGRFEIRDLNGDALSDLVVRPYDQRQLFIYLSQSGRNARSAP